MTSAKTRLNNTKTALMLLDVQVSWDDDEAVILVDATRLATRQNDLVIWELRQHDGVWHHYPSATSGTLGHMLWCIANSYAMFWPAEPRIR